MTFVALWKPAPTGGTPAASPDDGGRADEALGDALIRVAPHVALGETSEAGRIVWADARGLPARTVASEVLRVAQEMGHGEARVGVARVAIVAAVAARHGSARVVTVKRGAEGEYLAGKPLAVLASSPAWSVRLAAALADVGVETCGDLAALAADAVEVRFGAEGTALWKLARGEDQRRIFSQPRRALPSASLEWLEFETRDAERLLFVANRLIERVCDELRSWGETARTMTMRLPLAGGGAVEKKLRGARATADRATWVRLLRAELERLQLPDGVTGIGLRVDSVHELDAPQGDLFDNGFQSSSAAEQAVARLTDDEMGAPVRLQGSKHPLPEKRLRWRAMEFHEVAATVRGGVQGVKEPAAAYEATALALRLLPEPRRVIVTTKRRRGQAMPVRYRERLTGGARARRGLPLVEIIAAAGPDRVSIDTMEVPVSRSYWTCLTGEALVLLFRDESSETKPVPDATGEADDEWFLHGWWD
ncbi:MAG TPA: hypothetical protein VG432_17775 [Gemmatimonadaceae bacterium]|nr:hypothetical protein [Gemmatimonadaceae bacterium]